MVSSLSRERWGPWILALFCAGLAAVIQHQGIFVFPSGQDMTGLFSATLTLGGVLTGFMATVKAMLFSMPQSTYRRLKASDYINDLRRYLREAVWGGFVLCIASIAALYIRAGWMHPVIAGATVFVLAAVLRVAGISMSLMSTRE